MPIQHEQGRKEKINFLTVPKVSEQNLKRRKIALNIVTCLQFIFLKPANLYSLIYSLNLFP